MNYLKICLFILLLINWHNYYSQAKYINQQGSNNITKFKLGKNYLKEYKYEIALTTFKDLSFKEPSNPYYLLFQGICYYKLIQYNKAIHLLNQAVKLKQDLKLAHEYLSFAYADKYNDEFLIKGLNDPHCELLKKSLSQARVLIALTPNSAYSLALLATLAETQNYDLNTAITCYYKMLKLEPKNVNYSQNLAHCMALNANYTDSIKYYQYSLKLEPKNAFILAEIALIYKLSHNYQKYIQFKTSSLKMAINQNYPVKSIKYIKAKLLKNL